MSEMENDGTINDRPHHTSEEFTSEGHPAQEKGNPVESSDRKAILFTEEDLIPEQADIDALIMGDDDWDDAPSEDADIDALIMGDGDWNDAPSEDAGTDDLIMGDDDWDDSLAENEIDDEDIEDKPYDNLEDRLLTEFEISQLLQSLPIEGLESPSDDDVVGFIEEREAKEKALIKEMAEKNERKLRKNSDAIERRMEKRMKNRHAARRLRLFKMPSAALMIAGCLICFCIGFGAGNLYHNAHTFPEEYVTADNTKSGDDSDFRIRLFTQAAEIVILLAAGIAVYGITGKFSPKEEDSSEESESRFPATKADTERYRSQFMEKDNYNQLYSRNIGLSLNYQKTGCSANVLMIGAPVTDKIFQYIGMNILQENATQIISDPSGELFIQYAPYLLNKGYNVYRFNLTDFSASSYFNPLLYLFDDLGKVSRERVDAIVELYMKKSRKNAESDDPLWNRTERIFLTAMIYYVLENDDIPNEDKCFHTVLEKAEKIGILKMDSATPGENMLTAEMKSWLVKVAMCGKEVTTPAIYNDFLNAPAKIRTKIPKAVVRNLRIFATDGVYRVTRCPWEYEDTNMSIDFYEMAQTPSYLFLTIPPSHEEYDFLLSMMYYLMYAQFRELGRHTLQGKYFLGYRAEIPQFEAFDSWDEMMDFVDHVAEGNIVDYDYSNGTRMYYIQYKRRTYKRSTNRDALVKLIRDIPKMVYKCNNKPPELPIHVNFFWNQFQDIGEIPDFLSILSSSRDYRIGSHVFLQSFEQAQTVFTKKGYEELCASMDTTIFLGHNLRTDQKEIQKMLTNRSLKGKSDSTDDSIVSMSQLEKMSRNGHDNCVVMVQDMPPMIDRNIQLTKHPRYREFERVSKNLKKSGYDLLRYYDNMQEGL